MVLLNHVHPPKEDVAEGYIRDSEEHLRACTERVAVFLTARLCPKHEHPLRPLPRSQAG